MEFSFGALFLFKAKKADEGIAAATAAIIPPSPAVPKVAGAVPSPVAEKNVGA